MKVDTILKAKGRDVVTIKPDREILAAAEKLQQLNIGALVVSSDGSTPEGILSERDIIRGLAKHGAGCLQLKVRDLMTQHVISCSADDSIKRLMELMTDRMIRHVPVVDKGGRLRGIVSITDVVTDRLAELELEATVLRDAYITHG